MKANIHPDYHKIKVVTTKGEEIEMASTWGKEGDSMTLDVDPNSHPAWTGGVHIQKTGQVEKFAQRFGNISFGGKKNEN